MTRIIRAVDLFCGAGGTTTGLVRACEARGAKLDLLAVNHWPVAIDTHSRNHPSVRHMCQEVDRIDPRKVVPSGRLQLLLASPECTMHSIARGGRPVNDQSRATAWHVLKWAQEIYIDSILIENVREFRDWGPLGANGRPMKSRRGETYRAFLGALRSLGYTVEDRILNAADYGDATTRERLFILAQRGRKPIHWPEPTHSRTGGRSLLRETKRWRAAREIIDWSIESESIFARKRPLAPTTMARIAAGLRKFGGLEFVLPVNHGTGDVRSRSVNEPLPTLTARANQYLAQPFLVNLRGTAGNQIPASAKSLDDPIPTISAGGNHAAVCEPFILPHRMFNGMEVDSIDRPLRTIRANGGAEALVEPFLVRYQGSHAGKDDGARRIHSTAEPIRTVDTSNRFGLVQPFLVPFFGERDGQDPRTHSVDEPVPAVTSHGAGGLVEPFLLKYHRTGSAQSVDDPLDTITTRDRFALVQVAGAVYALDIRFRMLQPHELARAMGFDANYEFAGNRGDQVKQIGNAICVNLAAALCRALLWPEELAVTVLERARRTA